jgi:hypothetical protein
MRMKLSPLRGKAENDPLIAHSRLTTVIPNERSRYCSDRRGLYQSPDSRAARRSPVLHHGSPSFRLSSSMRNSPSRVCPPILRNFCMLHLPLSVRISCWNR